MNALNFDGRDRFDRLVLVHYQIRVSDLPHRMRKYVWIKVLSPGHSLSHHVLDVFMSADVVHGDNSQAP